ncbi:MAG: tRNA uridine-5-carboxymethylaminomethyl(34) synthesis GTPase MnmE, partial [Proteobacteria bacterium]|nr:tRNA uridine-5-carboxymethylaminomethyl(34) synthesis GTPase MnmE [Pseudomonadota bacterium]
DTGVLLYFKAPASFTGEDVIEIQAHGGHVVMNMLLKEVLNQGARMARPGEFSERAFLNGKIDLVQAEAIADIISSGSEQAVLASQRSLKGEFSAQVKTLLDKLLQTRVWVESAIDFPTEEIDFLSDKALGEQMTQLSQFVGELLKKTRTGVVLNKGITLVIVGKPNAGKSSLLNCFTQQNTAIISEMAGTTRDTIKEDIVINGIAVRIIDTAGIHQTDNPIEQQGIKRAIDAREQADVVIQLIDGSVTKQIKVSPNKKHITVINKSDLMEKDEQNQPDCYYVSALKQQGIDLLKKAITDTVTAGEPIEATYTARTRHINLLEKTSEHIKQAQQQLQQGQGELSAEELRMAQTHLNEITGAFSSDDLLGRIFSSFCIGK